MARLNRRQEACPITMARLLVPCQAPPRTGVAGPPHWTKY